MNPVVRSYIDAGQAVSAVLGSICHHGRIDEAQGRRLDETLDAFVQERKAFGAVDPASLPFAERKKTELMHIELKDRLQRFITGIEGRTLLVPDDLLLEVAFLVRKAKQTKDLARV